MHIHELMSICDHRMVEGCDYPWDVFDKECRVVMFEKHGPRYLNEHWPVEAVFSVEDLIIRQVTVAIGEDVFRWLDPAWHGSYEKQCKEHEYVPWGEPDLTWIRDINQLIALIENSMEPQEQPEDTEEVKWLDQ
jgi:hypothetical protein